MKSIALFFSCLFFAHGLRAQIPLATQQRMLDTVKLFQSTKKYKGLSAAVWLKGYGEWKGTAGNSHSGKPLSDSMVIGIGSNTKTFLASALLKLVELGMVSLDDSVGKWLPPMKNVKGSITLSQLLHHTSGLFNYTEHPHLGDSVNANPYRVWTKAELVNRFVNPPIFTPGQSWSYSNTNFLVAGMIAEQVSGFPVAELIRQRVLLPAGLNNTFFPPYEAVTSERTYVWANLGNGYLQGQMLPVEFYSVADAAGGMMSDAADNCRFWANLFNGNIISKSTLREKMMDWVPATSNLSYGLALMKQSVFGNTVFGHNGNILGQFCSNLTDTVHGICISVLSNQDSLTNDLIVYALYKILLPQSKIKTGITKLNERDLTIYPNPASTVIRVNSGAPIARVSVLDLTGRKLITSDDDGSSVAIDIQSLQAGVYLLEVVNEKSTTVTKFLKE
jgi:D-alanyl-D-alanine carboxypeptidase